MHNNKCTITTNKCTCAHQIPVHNNEQHNPHDHSDDVGSDDRRRGLLLAVGLLLGVTHHPRAAHRPVWRAAAVVAPVEVVLAVGRALRRRRVYFLGLRADGLPRPDHAALRHACADVREPAARGAAGLSLRRAVLAGGARGTAQLGVALRRLVVRAPLLGVTLVARDVGDHVT
eukprot:scaffold837_cov50-Phaeocystis_antarctica.AAC.2